MQLDSTLVSNIQDIYGEQGKTWLQDLPQHIEHLSRLWDFQFLKPMPNLSYNFVGLVKISGNKTAILKMSPKGGNLVPEMRWLKCIDTGVPELYAFEESLDAYLIEHLIPGYTLKNLVREGNDDDATKIISQLILKLQSQHCIKGDFRHLSEFSKSFNSLDGKLDTKILAKAKRLFHKLTNDRSRDNILHGDLHHDNILASGTDWKAIDPHGYVGDPAAEVGAMIRNALDCLLKSSDLQTVIRQRLKILTQELPYSQQNITDWSFCITALSGAWSVEDHGSIPNIVLDILQILDGVIVSSD